MNVAPSLTATVVISTRNRRSELGLALASAVAQTAAFEVLVVDDGSSDDTSEFVRREYPKVRLIQHVESKGYVVRRNEAAAAATGDIVFSIDDDATFESPHTVEETLREFEDPRIGAVAIPHFDVLTERLVNRPAAGTRTECIASFTGTAYAVRRRLFLELGGFADEMVHQGEEGDFCQRLLAAGRFVRLGSSTPIRHCESPRRNYARMEYFGRRNDVLQAWKHAPRRWVIIHVLATTVNGVRQAIRTRRPMAHIRGLLSGWAEIFSGRALRQPVTDAAYRAFRQLKKRGPLPIDDVERLLTP